VDVGDKEVHLRRVVCGVSLTRKSSTSIGVVASFVYRMVDERMSRVREMGRSLLVGVSTGLVVGAVLIVAALVLR
jgi:hypothetical protein